MAGRHAISFRTGRSVRCAVGALALTLICVGPTRSNGQQAPSVIVAPGNAAVTGFSGALPPIQIAPGADPGEKTFIDLHGPSLRVIDLQHMRGPPTAQLVGVSKPFTFTAAQIGQVFGVALDDNSPSNIYVAATSAYGLPIVAPGADGQPQHVKAGAPNVAFMQGLWGPQGGPGSIWKIDGLSGRVTLFANVMVGSRTNSGAALGALAFDPDSKSLFASDRESGLVYRLGLDGRILDRYDHGVTGRQAQGLPPVSWNQQQPIDITSPRFDSTEPATWNYAAPERRIFGLAVFQRRLYYAVADGLQIWSVGLNDDGSFGGDTVIELAVPPSSGPTEISKITFDEQGRMFLAERPAPTGAFDLEALAVPAIGRVLRYALIGRTPDGRRIWQEAPDQYAIGFPHDFRNDNGGVAVGYNYDHKGEFILSACGGFMWTSGEDLRDSTNAALTARLGQSGPIHVTGLQGNGTWRVEHTSEPPLESYFVDYADEVPDEAARGHMGDITIARPCMPRAQIFPSSPPQIPGARPIRHGGIPPGSGAPPGTPPFTPPGTPGTPPNVPGTPPGGCPPNQVRNVTTGSCGSCPRPNIQINGKCCPAASLAVNATCSNSSCPSGQTPIGPSNFCCNSSQVYAGPGGARACCSGQVVNGQCSSPTSPPTSNCPGGYVPVGGSCCAASQMTSTGACCPSGQTPSGPNKSQCTPFIPIPIPPLCCSAGQIPVAGQQSCCAAANVTSMGVCCSRPVDPSDRRYCPAKIQLAPACAAGYAKMPDGSCCNDRFVSRDGKSCNARQSPCGRGEFRDLSGACVPIVSPPQACGPGEALDRNGNCVVAPLPQVPPSCPTGEVIGLSGNCVSRLPPGCPPGEILDRRGRCASEGRPRCPSGQLEDRHGRCVSSGGARAPRCPPGQVFDRRGHCLDWALPRGRLPRSFVPPGFAPPGGRLGGPLGPPAGGFGPGGVRR
ncbi:MAG TPA: hypothetical protein VGJ20_32210 [Xanthobacteraceae bacterium]|jgi:hypothetical protein